MRDASGHNYRNSSFIVDVAMGQIPRSTERISSIINSIKSINIMLLLYRVGQKWTIFKSLELVCGDIEKRSIHQNVHSLFGVKAVF